VGVIDGLYNHSTDVCEAVRGGQKAYLMRWEGRESLLMCIRYGSPFNFCQQLPIYACITSSTPCCSQEPVEMKDSSYACMPASLSPLGQTTTPYLAQYVVFPSFTLLTCPSPCSRHFIHHALVPIPAVTDTTDNAQGRNQRRQARQDCQAQEGPSQAQAVSPSSATQQRSKLTFTELFPPTCSLSRTTGSESRRRTPMPLSVRSASSSVPSGRR
jgi:hypothetical protein